MKKYNLDSFLGNLFDWVDGFKFNDIPGQFSVIKGKRKSSLYGICDMVYNLIIPNQLDSYFNTHINEEKVRWIENIHSYQELKTGWFKDTYFNYKFRSPLTGQWEHATAFSVSVLKLLGTTPKYNLKISEELTSKKTIEKWLKKIPNWGLFFWPGSHRGGGVGAIFATLGKERYPNENFFDWYFEWLDNRADPDIGFWQQGWNHKIKKRLTKNELGGAIHYYWIYEFMGHPIPYPEKVIDSTLKLQNKLGLWDKDVSYCIDLDAIFSLLRCCKQTNGYKEEDIKDSIIRYLDYTIPSLNDKNFLLTHYNSAHKLTGCLEAIAEVYKFMPDLFDFSEPWIETLDITPWI